VVEQPVAEAITGFDETGPCLRAAAAVDPEAALLLEAADGGVRARPVRAVFIRPAVEPQPGESPLQVADRLAA